MWWFITSCRAKGNYTGLVSCVAQECQRITTQSQAEVHLRFTATAPDVPMETETTETTATTQLLNDEGVVTLVSTESQGDTSSSESEAEVVHLTPAPLTVKKIHEVGK